MKKKHTKKYILSAYILLFAFLSFSKLDILTLKNIAHMPQACYTLSIIGIAITLIALPVSVKLKRLNEKTRLLIQFGCAAINVMIHILTLETSSLLCALIALCISIAQKHDNTTEDAETNKQAQ